MQKISSLSNENAMPASVLKKASSMLSDNKSYNSSPNLTENEARQRKNLKLRETLTRNPKSVCRITNKRLCLF